MTMDTVGRLFASELPTLIKMARSRAVEHPQLFLRGKATALVQVLITYTNLSALTTPLRFNRQRPATLLGVSTRTIDRLLKELETLGWLTRLPQPRLGDGVWGCTSVKWSSWVIRDIFAVDRAPAVRAAKATDTPTKGSSEQPTKPCANRATQTAHLSSSPNGEVLQNKVASDDSGKTSPTRFDPFKETQDSNRRIPADLVEPMQQLGLTPGNMCLLMAHCKRKGKRLQHVLAATADQIKEKGLRAKDALGWLMYMIGLNRDYAYESRQAQAREQAQLKTAKRTALLRELADKAFKVGNVLPNGLIVAQRLDGVVTLARDDGSIATGAPEQHLVESMARANLSWVRAVLRGRQFSQPEPNNQQPVITTQESSPPVDRATIASHLAAMKEMVKRPLSFAGVNAVA